MDWYIPARNSSTPRMLAATIYVVTMTQIVPAQKTDSPNDEFCCPKCGCTRVYRSQRVNWQEKLMCLFQRVLPYRCRECDSRFYARKSK